jgi:hypothetical protein
MQIVDTIQANPQIENNLKTAQGGERPMEPVHADNVDSDSWKEYELYVLKTLFAFKFPMEIICRELDRSWTALVLKTIDLGLNYGQDQHARNTPDIILAKEIEN